MLASDSALNWPVSAHGSSAIGTARLAVGLLQGLVLRRQEPEAASGAV